MSLAFSAETQKAFDEMVVRYPQRKAALIPTLWLAQKEFGGWLSPESLEYVAKLVEVPPSKAYSVASFYTMFNLNPVGTYKIEVCRTLSCAMSGAFDVISALEERLGVKLGETSADGKYTLKTQECLAACGYGPVCQVNGERYYEQMDLSKLDDFVAKLS